MSLYGVLKAVHILCATIWIGGMFFAHMALRPSLTVLEPPQRLALMQQVLRRFFLIVWHAMPLMIASGLWIIIGVHGGMGGVPASVHVMMLIGLIMAGIFVYIFMMPWRSFRAAPDGAGLARIRGLIGINLILGLITTVIGALG